MCFISFCLMWPHFGGVMLNTVCGLMGGTQTPKEVIKCKHTHFKLPLEVNYWKLRYSSYLIMSIQFSLNYATQHHSHHFTLGCREILIAVGRVTCHTARIQISSPLCEPEMLMLYYLCYMLHICFVDPLLFLFEFTYIGQEQQHL